MLLAEENMLWIGFFGEATPGVMWNTWVVLKK